MPTILIVDDDTRIVELVKTHLVEQGYKTVEATDGMDALEKLQQFSCDLAIVDVMMPFMDGFQLTKEIRQKYNLPILLLTAKNQITDKEAGYEAGTDDYLVKPFEPLELIYRIKALLRRYEISDSPTFSIGNITVNTASSEVTIGTRTLFFPPKEFDLLVYFIQNKKQILSREQLIEHVWGIDFEGDERTIDVHVKRLREHFKKYAPLVQIKTIRGTGYMIEEVQ